ncbi:hypothetical protein KIPB_013689, partial [Kipferlia bialata]|eukprot:g13689.t1
MLVLVSGAVVVVGTLLLACVLYISRRETDPVVAALKRDVRDAEKRMRLATLEVNKAQTERETAKAAKEAADDAKAQLVKAHTAQTRAYKDERAHLTK